jgi:hypothetical protein
MIRRWSSFHHRYQTHGAPNNELENASVVNSDGRFTHVAMQNVSQERRRSLAMVQARDRGFPCIQPRPAVTLQRPSRSAIGEWPLHSLPLVV